MARRGGQSSSGSGLPEAILPLLHSTRPLSVRCVHQTKLSPSLGSARAIDGDGEVESLTDGVLVARWIFGFRGDVLVQNPVDEINCGDRCAAVDIEPCLDGLD